ncbi:hypothetical protein Q9966_002381 [Columba livia]|nr:hypothetical protein Q9966_002381 [Columba livia]
MWGHSGVRRHRDLPPASQSPLDFTSTSQGCPACGDLREIGQQCSQEQGTPLKCVGVKKRGYGGDSKRHLRGPAAQRQVQNGPSPDEMEAQRRQVMEQQQQRQESLERRTSTTGTYQTKHIESLPACLL